MRQLVRLALVGACALALRVAANPVLPALTLAHFDKPVPTAVHPLGRDTIAVYGDELDLRGRSFHMSAHGKRTSDIVIVARSIKLGPKTVFHMGGRHEPTDVNDMRGGDVYLVADTIELDGYSGELPTEGWMGMFRYPEAPLVPPAIVMREGGHTIQTPGDIRGRAGRIFVFTNKVKLADRFVRARMDAINVAGAGTAIVPLPVLKAISRSFSAANSIHRAVIADSGIAWSVLGERYRLWLAEEPASSLVVRELKLFLNPPDARYPADVMGSVAEANRHIPEQILAPWYLTYLKRNAAMAQAALANGDYGRALQAIRQAKPFASTAPTAALTDPAFSSSLGTLQQTEQVLAGRKVVEELSFPVEGAAPLRITVIRDLAASGIAVMPHQVLLNSVLDSGVVRLGFMVQEGPNVRLTMRGRLAVDPGVVELVRKKFPGAEIATAHKEITYDTVNLGLGDAMLSGAVMIERDGAIDLDLLLRGTQMTQVLQKMAQPFGIDASVNWQHQKLDLEARTMRLNLALSRSDIAIVANRGLLSNPFPYALTIDYILDGAQPLTAGLPLRVAPGAALKVPCATPLCYAPGTAIRRELAIADWATWFVSIPDSSSVQKYLIENHLEDDATRGGSFRSLVLHVTYKASPDAAPQKAGPFTLARRGAPNARHTLTFLAPPAGGGKLEISGRAYWGNGQSYRDLPVKVVESKVTLIDANWLK